MKRKRILGRRAWVWGLWGAVLLAGLAGLFCWHAVSSRERAIARFERYVGSPHYADYLPAGVPGPRNAAPAFAAAVPEGSADFPAPSQWSTEVAAAARASLEGAAPELEALAAAAELDRCVWPRGDAQEVESLTALLRAARLVRTLGFSGVYERNPDRVAASFRLLSRLADCSYAEPQLVGTLIGSAVDRMRLELIHAVVTQPSVDAELLAALAAGLRGSAAVDRVSRALAAEGAFALHSLEEEATRPGGLLRPLGWVFSQRLAAALASRWVELKAWSEQPLAELAAAPPEPRRGAMPAKVVADMMITNLLDAIFKMRLNRELLELALLAIEVRTQGLLEGSYSSAFESGRQLSILAEGDGSAVLIDSELDKLLRARFLAGEDVDAPGSESVRLLTVWRLPAPSRD